MLLERESSELPKKALFSTRVALKKALNETNKKASFSFVESVLLPTRVPEQKARPVELLHPFLFWTPCLSCPFWAPLFFYPSLWGITTLLYLSLFVHLYPSPPFPFGESYLSYPSYPSKSSKQLRQQKGQAFIKAAVPRTEPK